MIILNTVKLSVCLSWLGNGAMIAEYAKKLLVVVYELRATAKFLV